ncbi:aminoglycoside 6-adenylyltransferase [Alkalihalobacillus alcalophilus]|uniref:aminoglycoside 6-adenylyltransferase n=1 Tax=Alkalihalobacillus alcalophilus TaxID=1445 RepID=UPI0009DFCAF0|nr:aminoglycoside 6-adenylyltransferase [Alkalihalobacillus alcalophilus]MED1563920.1 aminoglycoside 6-adenylyltransferase [Alkalihalobacillus alcalophilus]
MYSSGDYEDFWRAIFITCELFRQLAQDVANHFNFTYPLEDDDNMTKYLKHISTLPADAKEVY